MMDQLKLKNFKALMVYDDCIIGAKGYNLCKYDLTSHTMTPYAKVIDSKYAMFSKFFLTRRFFRAEVTGWYKVNEHCELLIAKKGIFKKNENNQFVKCLHIPRGSRPMNLCVDKNQHIFFGEYFANMEKKGVNVYASYDKGVHWNIVYTFEDGNINHVHGIFYDPYTDYKWIVTGDRENECIIGYTDDDFKTLQIVYRGGQEYRSCNLLFDLENVYYITDSQYIQNEIKCINRKDKKITAIYKISGSGIYASQNKSTYLVSSTIEPSKVNTEQYSHLYLSTDSGKMWSDLVKYKKDIWNKNLFQFGSIQFPQYETTNNNLIVFSGRALKKIGGHTIILKNE